MSSYLFEKYRKDRCADCLRSVKCEKTEHDIILCSQSAYYKGPLDKDLLSVEEQRCLG